MKKITAMKHQLQSLAFMKGKKAVFDMSDPGTGKTFVEIMDFADRRKKRGGCALVVAPKSLLQAAWVNDVKKFAPHLKTSIAWAHCRDDAFNVDADIYIINVDGVKDLLKKPASFWKRFKGGTIIFDESTAFKHHTSKRSTAARKIVKYFEYRRTMSGTPTSNGICDIHHQVLLLDDGKRLGQSFYGFRNAVCIPEQTGPSANMLKWIDRPGVENTVIGLLSDIVIRHKFEDCIDIPPNHKYALNITLSPKHRKLYDELEKESFLEFSTTTITAINGAVLATKLLQAASGAVYNNDGGYSSFATDRYELVLDLVEARKHSIVFYHWEHQLEELLKEVKKRDITHKVWDADHPEIEHQYQQGFFQVLFAHPQSAGHGLTLTKGTATIWASPTPNLEHYLQGLKRIDRIGQKEKTETIVIVAEGTRDERIWQMMQDKKVRMDQLFDAAEAL